MHHPALGQFSFQSATQMQVAWKGSSACQLQDLKHNDGLLNFVSIIMLTLYWTAMYVLAMPRTCEALQLPEGHARLARRSAAGQVSTVWAVQPGLLG